MPTTATGYRKRFEEMSASNEDVWDMEFRALKPGGKTAWVHGVGRAERDADGHLIAYNGINVDVTVQKEAEAALRTSQAAEHEVSETLEQLLAASVEGILSTTPGGVIETANVALEAMFGYATGELSGQPLDLLIPEAKRASHNKLHTAYWDAPYSRPMGLGLELSGQRKDGTIFPIEVSLTYVSTVGGGRALGFVSDISERKRAEIELHQNHLALQAQADELRHRTDQLRRLASDLTIAEQLAREQFAKRLHDDLQQLLFTALMRVDRLAASAEESPAVKTAVDETRENLDLAIEAARSLALELFPPQLHEGGLPAAIRWLATWMEKKYGLTVEVTADPGATLDKKDRRTLAFESVRELLFDVVKHAKVTRATLDLALTSDDEIRITVADKGVGFDPAAVFARTTEGAGWGLFSIRERAGLLGGHLHVESAPGHGTRFTLVIPRSETRARGGRPPLRILIADDFALTRVGIRQVLSDSSEFEIVGEASTGTEAVALAQTLRPDAIVMDVGMPEMDGVEATRRIHATQPAIHIIGLSAQERTGDQHAIEKAGASGYLTKGADSHRLIEWLLSLRAKDKAPE